MGRFANYVECHRADLGRLKYKLFYKRKLFYLLYIKVYGQHFKALFSSLVISVASGWFILTLRSTSRITVVTMKKNKSMKIISGNDAVEIAGDDFPLFLLNFDS